MAVGTINKPNTVAPNITDPFGKIRDDSGANDGTPVNALVYHDLHAFFDSLMEAAGPIVYNGLPDNATNGFQLRQALFAAIRLNVLASTTQRGTIEIATNAELEAGAANNLAVVPSNFGAWTERNNVADVTATGGSGTTVTTSRIRYKLIGKTMNISFYAQISNTTAPTSFEVLIPASKSWKSFGSLTAVNIAGIIFDGSNSELCRLIISDSNPTKIQVVPATGVTLTNTQVTTISGSITFEVQ